MKKVLFVASVTFHITTFHIPYLKMFQEAGYEVHVASNGEDEIPFMDKHFQLPFERSPFKKENVKVYKELKEIMEKEKYDVIVCHTPVASILTRMATKKSRKNGTRVIYMAHGFHFFKGAPLQNWLIYYPIEKYFSNYTDDLITINGEDYELAKKKFKKPNVYKIHGIGVDATKFEKEITIEERNALREKLGLKEKDFAIFFAGELNKNKNQIMLIEAMKELVKENDTYKLLLAGKGPLEDFYRQKIKEYHLENNIFLLGYRKDIPEILKAVDLYVSTSKREGLGLNIVEAHISGLPVIATDNRGHRELIKNQENGFIVKIDDVIDLRKKIKILRTDSNIRNYFLKNARKEIEKFYLSSVQEEVKKIYLG